MRRIDFPEAATGVHSIDHFTLIEPDLDEAARFLTAFGLRATRLPDRVELRTDASDHHLLAFLASDGNGLHHAPWDMPVVEDVGLGNTQMRAAGYTEHWEPGRHVLGANYFNCVKDRFGQWWEFSAHIDYIGKDASWQVAGYADEDALYLWGPDMPADFPVNAES